MQSLQSGGASRNALVWWAFLCCIIALQQLAKSVDLDLTHDAVCRFDPCVDVS
jgi:hypothetical protein